MNLNVESHFAFAPTGVDLPRSQFDLSARTIFSANVSEIIPFSVQEVLPGDTWKVKTSKVVRLQTLLAPVMDNAYLDCYWFFVPNRLIWDDWKRFCGETRSAWDQTGTVTIPQLNISSHPGVGSLADYMGINPQITEHASGYYVPSVNALPFRAYAKICDDWFRDTNLSTSCVQYTDSVTRNMNALNSADFMCELGGPVYHACKYHDYFTSCLPAPQRGPAVTMPYTNNGLAPVAATSTDHVTDAYPMKLMPYGDTLKYWLRKDSSSNVSVVSDSSALSTDLAPVNLYANLGNTNFTINDLRTAFQIQRFYEKLAVGGNRYISIIKEFFGVNSPDARLQRSEYLGGNRVPLTVAEVTNNAASSGNPLGDVGALSRTSDVNEDFVKSFTEHGYLLGLCVVRYDHTYGQGLDRMWTRGTKFDFYWPVFANIGEQAVKNQEIYAIGDYDAGTGTYHWAGDEVFGYQEAWAEYRTGRDRFAGEMRPGVSNSLAHWHFGDYYTTRPTLSDAWIREDPANVDRCLAVQMSTANQYFSDFYVQAYVSRVMPTYSIPGLADHH